MERGSSPLARGTPLERVTVEGCSGLIPARAGNTPQPRYAPRPVRAHPRSRGEHLPAPLTTLTLSGSSPLARGTRSASAPIFPSTGLIPARAGNTQGDFFPAGRCEAHPRSRGEHAMHSEHLTKNRGSSPLARGTLARCKSFDKRVGLIPARAGNTSPCLTRNSDIRAHPRSRGEHPRSYSWLFSFLGSSPLARGTHT